MIIFILVDKYHLITVWGLGGSRAHHIHPATLLLWPHRDVFLARDGFSQSLSTLHLQPAGEEQDYSSLCNRGDQLLDLNAKEL